MSRPNEKSKPWSVGTYGDVKSFFPVRNSVVKDTVGFNRLNTSTLLKLANAMSTANKTSVIAAPKVVLNFSSPFQVKLTFYPNKSNSLNLFASYFLRVFYAASLSFIT